MGETLVFHMVNVYEVEITNLIPILSDDYLTMNVSSNRSHLGAKSSHFQAKFKSHTSLVFTVALIKNTECTTPWNAIHLDKDHPFHASLSDARASDRCTGLGCPRIGARSCPTSRTRSWCSTPRGTSPSTVSSVTPLEGSSSGPSASRKYTTTNFTNKYYRTTMSYFWYE